MNKKQKTFFEEKNEPDQAGAVFITETSQIQRHSTPGPTASRSASQSTSRIRKNEELMPLSVAKSASIDSETEKQVILTLKKVQKDMTTIEGKVNIISQIEGPREVLCCKYNEEYDYLAAGYADGIIRVYQSATGEHIFTLTDADVKDVRAPCTSIKHRPVSKIYPITNCFTGTYANGCVKCWSYHFNQCLYTIKEKRQTFGITYHPRFPKFVTYGDDLRVYFYDEESKTQERVLMASENPDKHDGHMSRVFAACFHPRNNYELITGGWDDVVQFWDLRQPYAIRHLSGIHICGEGLDINTKGTEILTCGFQTNDPLQIWDYGSGKGFLVWNQISTIVKSTFCLSLTLAVKLTYRIFFAAIISKFFTQIRLFLVDDQPFTSSYISPISECVACSAQGPSRLLLYCGKYVTKDFIVTGGTDPNLFRLVDLQTTATAACINFLPGAIYCIDIGQPKKKEKEKEREQVRIKSDASLVPKIAFVSTKKLYQVEFTS
ncbi:uncharacterized protein [Leptinotarsa decemlineata]|uniref:uncharacterized protein n=1 Tax=Leptinotarsa decemlineata TaxID=7539 RepID=UPI003D30CE42